MNAAHRFDRIHLGEDSPSEPRREVCRVFRPWRSEPWMNMKNC
jgi:hypothetical protein